MYQAGVKPGLPVRLSRPWPAEFLTPRTARQPVATHREPGCFSPSSSRPQAPPVDALAGGPQELALCRFEQLIPSWAANRQIGVELVKRGHDPVGGDAKERATECVGAAPGGGAVQRAIAGAGKPVIGLPPIHLRLGEVEQHLQMAVSLQAKDHAVAVQPVTLVRQQPRTIDLVRQARRPLPGHRQLGKRLNSVTRSKPSERLRRRQSLIIR
jgi:hypothetical protein